MKPIATLHQQRLVWWALWAAFLNGIVVLFFFLKKAAVSAEPSAFWQVGFLPVLMSGAVRWSVLPLFKDPQKALPIFVLGVAMAEASCFLGLFVFPSHQFPLFLASVVGILQFIPLYFDRQFAPTSGSR